MACASDAVEYRLAGLLDPSMGDLFASPISRRPTLDDVTIASWVQVTAQGDTRAVVVVRTESDAVLYVDARPVTAVPFDEVCRITAATLVPDRYISAASQDS